MKYQHLVGAYTLAKMKKNSIDYSPGDTSLYYKDLYIEKQSRWNILRRFNGTTDAFIVLLDKNNDSIKLYINKGGIGDSPDVIDSLTVLKGVYSLKNDSLTIRGIQARDTLQLQYLKKSIKQKDWFW